MSRQMIVIANRLPVRRTESGWAASPGGLVTALSPILIDRGGLWIGWSGEVDEDLDTFEHDGIQISGVPMSQSEIDYYYLGFSNETVWPLYHDGIRIPEYHRSWWSAYTAVNERFATRALECASSDDVFWVHDYQLQLVPRFLRSKRPDSDIRFFLHIPFPPVELFARLPWRREIVRSLLEADVVAFQTARSADNFKNAATAFGHATSEGDVLTVRNHRTRVVTAPISIDTADFERIAGLDSTIRRAKNLRRELGDPACVMLGADRLDYTKGIDVRLRAFEAMLEDLPGLAESVQFIQIAVPSRQTIGDYAMMREEIEGIAGRINGMYGRRHNMPVHYVYESLSREDLIAYYRVADVMVVTPLADGMNLVAKEFVASRVDEGGVLLLSEFAGAAEELKQALMVNPYDIDGMASEMTRAMLVDAEDARRRMREMRSTVRANDVHHWTRRALGEVQPVTVG